MSEFSDECKKISQRFNEINEKERGKIMEEENINPGTRQLQKDCDDLYNNIEGLQGKLRNHFRRKKVWRKPK